MADLQNTLHHTHNMPHHLSSFVGRERESVEVQHMITSSRLVTLTGMGGCGKTRLALHVITGLMATETPTFSAGIWFVELAHLSDPTLLTQALAQILGIRKEMEKALINDICECIGNKKVLLVLDTCEHLIEACASLVETLLRQCPHLHIMATSREALRIGGEHILPIPPLAIPVLNTETEYAFEQFLQCETVQLFTERARSVDPHFRVTRHNAPGLASVCQWLEGLPLAIELAAAHVNLIPVEQMAEQFLHGTCFSLLSGGSRIAQPRQQTLRATLDWSYYLLSEDEQKLLRHVAVFTDGWDLEAFYSICAEESTEQQSMFEGLAQLISKSLVLVEERSTLREFMREQEPASTVRARYHLARSVRQYAQEKLRQAGEREHMQRQHLAYFLALAEKAEPALRSSAQHSCQQCLETEYENLCTALKNAQMLGRDEEGLRLACALWWFWILRTHLRAGRQWFNELLHSKARIPDPLRATALYKAGMLAFFHGDLAAVDQLSQESLSIFRHLQEEQDIANTLASLIHVSLRQGDYEQAQTRSSECLALARTTSERWHLAFALLPCAVLKTRLRDYADALVMGQEALEIFRACGDRLGMAYALDVLGRTTSAQEDFFAADLCFQQSLLVFEALNHINGKARSLLNRGLALVEIGNYAEASSTLEQSLQLCVAFGRRIGIARALLGLGQIELRQHNYQSAVTMLGQGLTIFEEHGDMLGVAGTLYNLGRVALVERSPQTTLLASSRTRQQRSSKSAVAGSLLAAIVTTSPRSSRSAYSQEWLRRVDRSMQKMWTDAGMHTPPATLVRTLLGEKYPQQALILEHYDLAGTRTTHTILSTARTDKQHSSPHMPDEPSTLTEKLTRREQETLQLIAQGLSNAQIARQLVISTGTVRTHLEAIYGKLGVTNRTAAAHYAREHALL